ncbi:MAG: hypothetical protein QOJ45_119 [Verrucomicrobiota bacterium]
MKTVVHGVVIQNELGEDRLLVKIPAHFASTEEELLAAAKRLQPIMSLPFLVVAQQPDGSWISAMDTRCTDITIPAWLDALDWNDIEVQWHE